MKTSLFQIGKALVLASALAMTADAIEVDGIRFANTVKVAETELELLGAGLGRKLVFKVFAGAFYMEKGLAAEDRFKNVPRKLVLEYYRSISAQAFAKATEDSLAKSVEAETLLQMRGNLDKLKNAYKPVNRGDRYCLTHIPGKGMILSLNDNPIAHFEDPAFINAVFGIWLGDNPIDERFKRSALGLS